MSIPKLHKKKGCIKHPIKTHIEERTATCEFLAIKKGVSPPIKTPLYDSITSIFLGRIVTMNYEKK